VVVDDDGRVVRMLAVCRDVFLGEVVPHELLLAENIDVT
jgi:hypothetical protein